MLNMGSKIYKLILVLILVFPIIFGIIYSYVKVYRSGYNNGYEDGYYRGKIDGVREERNTFMSLHWGSCINLNEYQPIVTEILEDYPIISNNSITLKFGKGGKLGYFIFDGTTRSMSPTIEPGYIVIYQENPIDIKVGDIVGFTLNECEGKEGSYEIWVHRVLGIVSRNGTYYFITKGDNNRELDKCNITYQDIKYRVVAILPSTLEIKSK